MTDAPEKITLTPDYSFGDPWFNGSIGNDDPMEDGEDTSYGYTRDDISDAPNSNIKALCDQLAKVSMERTKAHERVKQLESQAVGFRESLRKAALDSEHGHEILDLCWDSYFPEMPMETNK
jgi:hypothetical protein